MDGSTVRNLQAKDAERILEIYAYYVLNTAITFEYDVPSLPEFRRRIENISERFPYLVIEQNGTVRGYAYAAPFRNRAAYGWSCETTIYMDHNFQKSGMGRRLYEELENRLQKMGILNMYACIAYPQEEDRYLTKNSAEFHEHMGFAKVGEFHKCGYKSCHWYDMIWMEKIIGRHIEDQPPVIFNVSAPKP